jgi:hypothetical protein
MFRDRDLISLACHFNSRLPKPPGLFLELYPDDSVGQIVTEFVVVGVFAHAGDVGVTPRPLYRADGRKIERKPRLTLIYLPHLD